MPQMYVEYRNGVPVAYRYGEEWVAMQLRMEGGYKTPEEAIAAWKREVDNAPTIEAEPVRHGRWDYGKKHADFVEATCTACNGILLVKWYSELSEYRYCPNCGAKMDKEEA